MLGTVTHEMLENLVACLFCINSDIEMSRRVGRQHPDHLATSHGDQRFLEP